MAATATRRAQRAARHAGRALRRRKIPEVLGAVTAAVVLALGGTALTLEASHDGGPGYAEHGMMQQFNGPGPGGGPEQFHHDHMAHPPWEH